MMMSRKDEPDKSITFHQVIMLALFGAFVSLASFVYQNEETMSNVVFFCFMCALLDSCSYGCCSVFTNPEKNQGIEGLMKIIGLCMITIVPALIFLAAIIYGEKKYSK